MTFDEAERCIKSAKVEYRFVGGTLYEQEVLGFGLGCASEACSHTTHGRIDYMHSSAAFCAALFSSVITKFAIRLTIYWFCLLNVHLELNTKFLDLCKLNVHLQGHFKNSKILNIRRLFVPT